MSSCESCGDYSYENCGSKCSDGDRIRIGYWRYSGSECTRCGCITLIFVFPDQLGGDGFEVSRDSQRKALDSEDERGHKAEETYTSCTAVGSKTLHNLAQSMCVTHHVLLSVTFSLSAQVSQLQASHSSCQLIGSSAPSTLKI
jgi:hypothetical protein